MNLKLLGKRIREARENQGLSQSGLARLIGKDQGAISEYEKGRRKIPAIEIPALASALNVPPSYFFGEGVELNELDEVMMYEFQKLSTDEAKQIVIDIVRMIGRSFQNQPQEHID